MLVIICLLGWVSDPDKRNSTGYFPPAILTIVQFDQICPLLKNAFDKKIVCPKCERNFFRHIQNFAAILS